MRNALLLASALLLSTTCVSGLRAQSPATVELANLREDVRILTQRTGEMQLRLELIERENAELRTRLASSNQSLASIAQLNAAVADLNAAIKSTSASAKTETLQQVAAQMEKLARQTNAAIDSLAKGLATRPPVNPPAFTDDYAKDGVSYTVQKGDTLALIAKKTAARQQDIINANRITDPSKINVGQTLFIPAAK